MDQAAAVDLGTAEIQGVEVGQPFESVQVAVRHLSPQWSRCR